MQQFFRNFVRDPQGRWRCISPADLKLPNGRIQVAPGMEFQRGTKFMNVDVAQLLDEEFERQRQRR